MSPLVELIWFAGFILAFMGVLLKMKGESGESFMVAYLFLIGFFIAIYLVLEH